MSKFMEAIRRLFSRKGTDSGSTSSQNEVQKAPPRAPRSYDDVTIGGDGKGPTVGKDEQENDMQTPKRAPRPYDEVDINGPPKEGGTVQVK